MLLCQNCKNGTVGVDLGDRYIDYCICPPDGTAPIRGRYPTSAHATDQLLAIMRDHNALSYCVLVETGWMGYAFPRGLLTANACGHVIDGNTIVRGRRGRKSNSIDAFLIATQAVYGDLREVVIPTCEIEGHQKLCREYDKLLDLRQSYRGGLEALAKNQGWARPSGLTPWTREYDRWLDSLNVGGDAINMGLVRKRKILRECEAHLEEANREIRAITHCPTHSRYTALLSPIVQDPVVLLTLATELHSPWRFPDGRNVVAFAGFDTDLDDSGERRKKGKSTKTGNRQLHRAAFHVGKKLHQARRRQLDSQLTHLNDPAAVYVRQLLAKIEEAKERIQSSGASMKNAHHILAATFLEALLPILQVCYPAHDEPNLMADVPF